MTVAEIAAMVAAAASSATLGVNLWVAHAARKAEATRDQLKWNREVLLVSLKETAQHIDSFVEAVEDGSDPNAAFIALSKRARDFDFSSQSLRIHCHTLVVSGGELHSAIMNGMGSGIVHERLTQFRYAVEAWEAAARQELGLTS